MTMKVGIDSYCFHRYFGEVYPHQTPPPAEDAMGMQDFLAFAMKLGVDGVSLESCFFPSFDKEWLLDLKAQLDDAGFDRRIRDSLALMEQLAEQQLPYETLLLPLERHGVRAPVQRMYLEARILEFFERALA